MIYGIVCTTLILLRKKNPDQANFYKLKHGNTIAVAGILITLWLLSSSRLRELRDVGIATVSYTHLDVYKRQLLLSANPENDKQFKVFVSPGIYYINIIDVKGISTSTRFISY